MRRAVRFGAKGAATLVVLAVAGSALARTGPAPQKKLGTIRATVDGEARTWHVLEATVDGKLEPGAFWKDMGDGSRMVALGGYDRADVPFETFERDPDTGVVTSFGEYDGGLITLTFEVREGAAAPLSFGPSSASVIVLPGVDYGSMLSMETGHVELTALDWDRGRFRGAFEGELQSMDGSRTIQVTNGSFEVEGGLSLDELD